MRKKLLLMGTIVILPMVLTAQPGVLAGMETGSASTEIPVSMQNQQVSGTVTDARTGETLPGANIIVKGTNIGTTTNMEGNFQITAPSLQDTLIFAYVGYRRTEVPIDGQTQLIVELDPDVIMGEETVVIGYAGAVNRREVTGAVSTVNMADFERRQVPNVLQAVQGQVPGVQIQAATGAPGEEIQIRIRGEGTIGVNDPLFVVDGVPTRTIGFLDPADIASMDVLKDASSAALYGSRAAGGVIIIETKRGIPDEPSFNVNYYSGMSHIVNRPNMMDAEQYMNTVEKAWENAGFGDPNPYTEDMGRPDFADTDWLDETFTTGYTHNLHVSASGGIGNTRYYISSRYYLEDGAVVFDNDKVELFNFRVNLNTQATDRLRVGTNTQLSYFEKDNLDARGHAPGIIRHAMLRPPIIPVKKDEDDPHYSEDDPFTDLPFYRGPDDHQANKYEYSQNPVALAHFWDNVIKQYRTFGNVFGEYDLLENRNLKFRSNIGLDLLFHHHKVFNENFGDDDGGGSPIDAGLGRQNRPNSISDNRMDDITVSWTNTLNFRERFDVHGVSGVAGTEYITSSMRNMGASRARFDFTDDNFRFLDFGGTELGLTNSGSGADWALFSYFGSLSYDFDRRYMATVNFRADASSRFADDNQWGYFPSVSAGWMISEENFMQDVDWISMLKLRGSWGQLGNQEIPNYAYLTLLERTAAGQYEVIRYGNPDLRWETTTQSNVGFDMLIRDRLSITVEYFNMLTSDILLPITLPEVVGDVDATFVNAGEVRNTGFEFSTSFRHRINEFNYRINANVGILNNEVESLHPNLPNIVGDVTRTQPGHPINTYFGYVMEGIYQTEAEIEEHLHGMSNPTSTIRPGDIRFKDMNDDGVIDSDDRAFIGDPHPDYTFGLTLSGHYRNFDFSVFFQGVMGIDRFNDGKRILDFDTRPFNYTTDVLDAWDGEGSTNSRPRVSFTDTGISRNSSIYVEDASYVRLKNLEIGYSLTSLLGHRMDHIRIFASGQNLLTVTNYTGLDPESTDLMDRGTYPQSRRIMVGINTSF